MNASIKAVSLPLVGVVVVAQILGQVNAGEIEKLPACASVHRSGRHITGHLAGINFYVPRFTHVTRVQDIDYIEYHVRYGAKRDKPGLRFMFAVLGGGESPDDLGNPSIEWSRRRWECRPGEGVTEWRGAAADGRHWRHVKFAFGFAAYKGVPPEAALYFDKILDTMCCEKCSTCGN